MSKLKLAFISAVLVATAVAAHAAGTLRVGMQDDPERVWELREQVARAGVAPWLTIVGRAVARGELDAAALTPRVATVALNLLRSEYGLNGATAVPRGVLVEIVDQVFLPLARATR